MLLEYPHYLPRDVVRVEVAVVMRQAVAPVSP